MSDLKIKRREFIKKTAYAAPVILSLKAMPAFAAAGSGNDKPKSRGGSKGDPSERNAPKTEKSAAKKP
jgi:hypothetical protein